jgi:hypothetical protein
LTRFGSGFRRWPAWSPDGTILTFDSRVEGQSEIYVVHLDGGQPRRITSHPASDIAPSFSHDGRWIYFSSDRGDRRGGWRTLADGAGTAVQVVTQATVAGVFESSNGQYLIYGTKRGVFRVPLAEPSGQPEFLFEASGLCQIAGTKDGLFYSSNDSKKRALYFVPYSSRNLELVSPFPKPFHVGMSATHDGRLCW